MLANNGNALEAVWNISGNLLWHDLIKSEHILKRGLFTQMTIIDMFSSEAEWSMPVSSARVCFYLILSAKKAPMGSDQGRKLATLFFSANSINKM